MVQQLNANIIEIKCCARLVCGEPLKLKNGSLIRLTCISFLDFRTSDLVMIVIFLDYLIYNVVLLTKLMQLVQLVGTIHVWRFILLA